MQALSFFMASFCAEFLILFGKLFVSCRHLSFPRNGRIFKKKKKPTKTSTFKCLENFEHCRKGTWHVLFLLFYNPGGLAFHSLWGLIIFTGGGLMLYRHRVWKMGFVGGFTCFSLWLHESGSTENLTQNRKVQRVLILFNIPVGLSLLLPRAWYVCVCVP